MHLPTLRPPRYADIASTLALVVAMGGTAYATAAVGTSNIKSGAVTTPQLADRAVTSRKIHGAAVTSFKLATGAVTGAKLADDSVTGPKVANESLSLSDLVGISRTGFISFSLGANACGTIAIGVGGGAVVGQAALLTWTGTVPPSVVVSPLKVVSPTRSQPCCAT